MTQQTNLQRAKEVDNFLKDFKEMLCHNGIWDEERYKYYEKALDEITASTYLQAVEDILVMAPGMLIKSKGEEERVEYDFGVKEYMARIESLKK